MNIRDQFQYQTRWTIRRFANEADYRADRPYDETYIDRNLLLNEGIEEMLDLMCGLGSPTNFGAANAYIGVGDSTTAASASQTGLQASTNKLYKAMDTSYPVRSGQTVTWQAVFGSGDANFDWREFTVANGNSDAAKNLNRKVDNQGTKVAGQVWTVTLSITIS